MHTQASKTTAKAWTRDHPREADNRMLLTREKLQEVLWVRI